MLPLFADLIQIAGITILVVMLWAASVAFTYRDSHRHHQTGVKNFIWIVLVVLLPFLGFIFYLLLQVLPHRISSINKPTDLTTRRETLLKGHPTKRDILPTYIASDLGMQTVIKPQKTDLVVAGQVLKTTKFIFTVFSGKDQGKIFLIEKLPAWIGRGSQATIRLDGDLGVSRKHAEIYSQKGALRIRDLESTHGTKINGKPIEDEKLEPGDQLQIGLSVLVMSTLEE